MLLMSCGYDNDDVYVLIDLEDKFGVKYNNDELERIRKENWTLGRFVKDLLERCVKRENGH